MMAVNIAVFSQAPDAGDSRRSSLASGGGGEWADERFRWEQAAALGLANATGSTSTSTPAATPEPPFMPSIPEQVIYGLVMAAISAGTVGGNILVVLSLLLVKKLRQPANLLLFSLSVSDQLIALTVEPFAAYKTVTAHWYLSEPMCRIHLFFDVMLCTASILNLNAITIDRFLVITRPFQYTPKRTKLLMLGMITVVWVLSAIVSASVYLPWPWPEQISKSNWDRRMCTYTDDIKYQIFATITAFWGPLIIMLVLWGRIFIVAREMARADRTQQNAAIRTNERANACAPTPSPVTSSTPTGAPAAANVCALALPSPEQVLELKRLSERGRHAGFDDVADDNHAADNHAADAEHPNGSAKKYSDQSDTQPLAASGSSASASGGARVTPNRASVASSSGHGTAAAKKPKQKNENKALVTVAIIIGCFSACWIPFFTFQLLNPIYAVITGNMAGLHEQLPENIDHYIMSVLLWLGYLNSFMNPLIYAKFNRDFRRPFKEFLRCHCTDVNQRLRIEQYNEQFGSPTRQAGAKRGSGGSGGTLPAARGGGSKGGMTRRDAQQSGLLRARNGLSSARCLELPQGGSGGAGAPGSGPASPSLQQTQQPSPFTVVDPPVAVTNGSPLNGDCKPHAV